MKDIGGPHNIHGNKWSQEVGREVFSILIQMAIDNEGPITYGELADKVAESGVELTESKGRCAQSMICPLACVLKTLFEYYEETGFDVPYFTIIVVNNRTGLPTHFSTGQGWSDNKIQSQQQAVYDYEHWDDVRQTILGQ